MIRKIQISIPTQCHEQWDKMSPAEKGKFCGSCQKNVYDFTKSSDMEILTRLNSEKNICGRFLPGQLGRPLSKQQSKSNLWIAVASGFLAFIGLGTQFSNAQVKGLQVQTRDNLHTTRIVLGMPNRRRISEKLISGEVRDENGNPLANAYVAASGSSKTTKTDKNGRFSLSIISDDELSVVYDETRLATVKTDERTSYTILVRTKLKSANPKSIQAGNPVKPIPGKTPILNADKIIYGMVSDETGPLPGANIWIEGTDRGTQADIYGKFTLQVTEGEIINCGYAGKQNLSLQIDKHNAYKIKLKQDEMVKGEVVTGSMGIIRPTK